MYTFNILVQLLPANYCAFCCFSKDIKKNEKSVVYVHTLCALFYGAKYSSYPDHAGSNTYRVSSAGLAQLL